MKLEKQSDFSPSIADVAAYWERHPLLSYEFAAPGTPAFFDALDRVKRDDIERFALRYWDFPGYRGRKVLDIGCGPGWVSVQYAAAGAEVTAVDLTEAAVDLTKKHLAYRGLKATVRQANAETLPFADASFDMVFSSGVLHHTPETMKAFSEAFRVLAPGGLAKITLYRLGILHSPVVFGLTRGVMQALGVKHPGADLGRNARSVEDFVRRYDGDENPIGIAKTDRAWAEDLRRTGFEVIATERHFFPKRFIPAGRLMPGFVHRLADGALGTMVYFNLRKPG